MQVLNQYLLSYNPQGNHQKNLFFDFYQNNYTTIVAISSDTTLYLCNFITNPKLSQQIALIANFKQAVFIHKKTKIIDSLFQQLTEYFAGNRQSFELKYQLVGTNFQQQVWQSLTNIAYAQTISYATQAKMLHMPKGYRAVANANANNKLALIIPCHRVIKTNNELGGFASGVTLKQQLINLEQIYLSNQITY